DKKHQYLFDIPLVENYLLQILSKYPDLEGLKNLILEEKDKKAIMILAAGKGERMMPLTESIPKPLLKIGDKALIDYSIASALNAGFSKIVVNTFYLGNLISSHLSDRYQDIVISEEKSPLETAGGIINALTHLGNNPFAVMNSDVYTNFRLEKLSLPENSLAHLVLVKNPEHNPEGDFSLDEQSFINITSKNQYTFSGIGIYHPELFRHFMHCTGKLPLYKVLLQAIDNHQVTGELFDDVWFDVGTPERLKNINKFQAESNNL
ncbi:MAG: nucleotidyltransferase family protein, partial [Gammaproteobacteria bacterium]